MFNDCWANHWKYLLGDISFLGRRESKRLFGVNIFYADVNYFIKWCDHSTTDVNILRFKVYLYLHRRLWYRKRSQFLLPHLYSLQLPSCSFPPYNPHSRHKDTLFSLDCEHGSLSLNVSGKWLIWSHLPKSYWNAAVVGQLFKTPEIHRPRWHFPVFGTTIAIALDIFYMRVCTYIIFFTRNILRWKKKPFSAFFPTNSDPCSILLWVKKKKKKQQETP